MRVLEIVGARPQFIKLAPVDRALRTVADPIIVHTGQHYDYAMSSVFFERLGLPEPACNLNVGSGSHGFQTGEMLCRLEEVMLQERPDLVLVFGDTNSTLAGALAAAKLRIPVAHVEAGLRSRNRAMPEEINRIVTDHVSDLLFAPTEHAVACLEHEGIAERAYLVGDVMHDALIAHQSLIDASDAAARFGLDGRPFALVTIHRAGNTDDLSRLASLMDALARLPMDVVFPMHPRTRQRLLAAGLAVDGHVRIVDPVDYFDMIALERLADVILTDSGGVQKEAYLLGTPCVTLRDETEWTETVDAGWNLLVGSDRDAILEAATTFRPTGPRPAAFGDGTAAEKIAAIVAGTFEAGIGSGR